MCSKLISWIQSSWVEILSKTLKWFEEMDFCISFSFAYSLATVAIMPSHVIGSIEFPISLTLSACSCSGCFFSRSCFFYLVHDTFYQQLAYLEIWACSFKCFRILKCGGFEQPEEVGIGGHVCNDSQSDKNELNSKISLEMFEGITREVVEETGVPDIYLVIIFSQTRVHGLWSMLSWLGIW